MSWVREVSRVLALVDGVDVLGLVGLVSVLYGIARWSVPAAWIVGGGVLVAVAILPHVRKGKRR